MFVPRHGGTDRRSMTGNSSTPASPAAGRLSLAALAAILILTYAVYWPGLDGPLLLDDLSQLGAIMEASDRGIDYLAANFMISSSGPIGRPVAMFTFIADAALFGEATRWWKHTNLLLHLLSGALVFWLTSLLVTAARPQSGNEGRYLALAVAALWLLHPLNVSTVLYTVQRMTVLSTLFVLAALIAYVAGRLMQERDPGRGWFLIATGFCVFFPLGVLSKENALLFPVYVSLVEWLVLGFRGTPAVRTAMTRLHWALVAGYAVAFILVLVNFSSIVLDAYAHRDFTLTERVLTQFRVVSIYIGQTFIPLQQTMGLFHDAIPRSLGLFTPPTTVLALLFLLGLAASAVALRLKRPLFAFGILLFFASHVMESTVLGLELMFEHRNYLGSFALLLAAGDLVVWLIGSARVRAVIATAAVVMLCVVTVQRSLTWSSVESFYDHELRVHPNSARVNQVFANAAAQAGDYVAAREYLEKSGSMLDQAMQSVLFDCLESGRIEDAAVNRVVSAEYDFVAAVVATTTDRIVRQVIFGGCEAPASTLYRLLDYVLGLNVRSAVDRQILYFARAMTDEWAGDIAASLEAYELAQAANPDDALASYEASDLLARHGRYEEAFDVLGRAMQLDATTRRDRSDLAVLIYGGVGQMYAESGRAEEALALYADARAAMPNRAVFHIKSAELLIKMGRFDAAGALLDELGTRAYIDWDENAEAIETLVTELEEKREGAAGNDREG